MRLQHANVKYSNASNKSSEDYLGGKGAKRRNILFPTILMLPQKRFQPISSLHCTRSVSGPYLSRIWSERLDTEQIRSGYGSDTGEPDF